MTRLQDFLNSDIKDVAPMGRAAKVGDLFGLELECEGRNVDYDGSDDVLKGWAPHADGSLRAHHGSACEWVFNGPVKYKTSVERVNTLFAYFEKRKARLVTSNRTSTHIHFNMGDKKVYQLVNMFILFTILEDVLDHFCGEDRKGNLFCLSSRHAEEQIRRIEEACFKNYVLRFNDNNRYTSFNVAAINKFGTVEFRGMRGLDNRDDVVFWLSVINQFCDYACYKMQNPSRLVEEISQKTPLGFLSEIFDKDTLRKLIDGRSEQEVSGSIYEGLRLVQMLCYRIGTEFSEVRLRGRDFWASFREDDPEPDQPEMAMEAPRRGPNEGIAAFVRRAQQQQVRFDPDRAQPGAFRAVEDVQPIAPPRDPEEALREAIRLGNANFDARRNKFVHIDGRVWSHLRQGWVAPARRPF